MKKQFTVFIFTVLLLTMFACKNDFEIDGTVLVEYRGNAANIIIPKVVTYILYEAFIGCENLVNITIPSSVTDIEDGAFSRCENLTGITIPSSVTSIGWCAFAFCVSLNSVTIPSSITYIGIEAFEDCDNLKTVSVSRKTIIGKGAFPAHAQITYRD